MTAVRFLRAFAAAVLTAVLAGCSVAPPTPGDGRVTLPVADWQPAPAPEAWRLTGRAALHAGDDGGTVSVFWESGGDRYRLTLNGPIGSGAVRLEGDAGGITLRTSDGRVRRAGSARALLRAETGYDLPVSYLRWWVRARAVPELGGRVRLDDDDRPVSLVQDGWHVTYDEFRRVDGYWLPHRLSVERGDVSVRLAVREWRAGPSS
ncbi:lipoprotein insertase outer membrane protein LolB [Arhodomonas aquaeolei]|uniref:lipoprotein insertase outer membrane protein LolB n=1 Tax=Arhodomonas aquaeolei TaxID=2369 RepID=UPI000374BB0A|nr:lipoprotein insertase outer membrane protein LolB [Arhodomonas aquaeolei]MCS4504110.1 lipoprotein insertase outer membrane protein LolB [Arhodomonas aquaeolei]